MPSSKLYHELFNSHPDQSGEADLLRKITAEHPYFSLAHLYLLQSTPSTHADHKKIAARTALHIQNPFLLRYLLQKDHDTVSTVQENRLFVHEDESQAQSDIASSISHGEQLISRMTEEISKKATEPVAVSPESEPLLFEPLHTTDYFASQGIRLSEEMQSGDKLGKQLKSFTEWLKTMKKKQSVQAAEEISTTVDPAVEHMAEKSNKEEDVITETMAEVFISQGKKNRAREIYEKLLLQNPSKSAYFAAKIDSLKEK